MYLSKFPNRSKRTVIHSSYKLLYTVIYKNQQVPGMCICRIGFIEHIIMSVGRHFWRSSRAKVLLKAGQITLGGSGPHPVEFLMSSKDADSITSLSSCSNSDYLYRDNFFLMSHHNFLYTNFSLLPLSCPCALREGSGSVFCKPPH